MIIGLDLDNTIIDYQAIFLQLAIRHGITPAHLRQSKEEVRAATWASAGGDELWQEFQAVAYGPGIQGAELFPGFNEFIKAGRTRNDTFFIASHKTQYSPKNPGCDLRAEALEWLQRRGFFGAELGFLQSDVFFADTRDIKVSHLAGRACDVFIDDLVEVLDHPHFPQGVRRVLFAPQGVVPAPSAPGAPPGGAHYTVVDSWPSISRLIGYAS